MPLEQSQSVSASRGRLSRRGFLRLSGLGLAAASGLLAAACGSSAPAEPTAAPTRTAAPAASPLPSPSPGVRPSPSPLPPSPIPSPSPSAAPTLTPLAISPYPFAAMIDNIVAARPHSGLDQADVVYEAPAEGGIPRLMPVFLTAGGERIGPVRSARDYFVYLAAEYGVALVHIGASPGGFRALQQTGTVRVDETLDHAGFTRDPRRLAPHNAFVSASGVRAGLERRGATLEGTQAGLLFGPYQSGKDTTSGVRIAYPGGERYVVQYEYSQDTRTYLRSMDGQPHTDGVTGERYAARSILVQYLPVSLIPGDDAGRLSVQLVGTGSGLLIAEGTAAPLSWSKSGISSPTRWRRDDGATFALPQGQVWIQLVPDEARAELS